jgi:lambda family phage tail tape measure protein
VRDQIAALEKELAEKLVQQGETVRAHLEKIRDSAENRDLKRRMDAEDTKFRQFDTHYKNQTRDDDASFAVDTRQAGQQLRNDSAQASYMQDPRWSARFSQVQRTALTRKTAADSDIADQQTLAAQNAQALRIEEERQKAQDELNRITAQLSKVQDSSKGFPKDSNDEKRANEEIKQLKDEQIKANSLLEASDTRRKKNAQAIAETEEKISAKKADPMSLMEGINAANQNFLETHDAMASAIDGYNSLLGTATNSFATFFNDIVTRSKSAGDAIKDFARSFLQAMLQILEQQAALAVVKTIISAFGGGGGQAPGTTSGVNAYNFQMPSAIQGGVVSAGGTMTRGGSIARFAQGGTVQGPIGTRDSVTALLKPGEVVMNQDAVDSVGEDFLNGLNAQGNRVMSKSTPAPAAKRERQPDHVNVYVVAPDQKPQMGPRDILATISDDVMRGGTTKQLIKQVAMGQM